MRTWWTLVTQDTDVQDTEDSMTAVVRLARAIGAAVLLLALGTAAASPAVPWPALAIGVCALLGGAWRPGLALPLVLAVVPWGERLAAVPVRASELVLWAFVAGWCLRLTEGPVSGPRLRRAAVPALLFLAVVIASWMRVELQQPAVPGWPGVSSLLRLVPADYLVTAGRAPHTAAMLQVALAVAVFLAVPGLARRDPAVPRRVLFSVAAAGLLAAVLSVVAVPVIYFTTGDWNEIDRYISATRSRGAFHLQDVNAAGSQYILAALLSLVQEPVGRGARLAWGLGQSAIVVGLWMSGSRAAITAGAAGVAVWAAVTWLAGRGDLGAPRLSPRLLGACGVAVIVALTGSVRLGSADATTGSASRSLSIRGEFLQTSLDMMATAPVTGVGIGTYYTRSSEFMPPGLHAIYGHENAHNYFMQVGAELGLVGLLAFLWWLGRALGAGWMQVRREGWRGPAFAAVCACGAYLLTCVTGHPFLVVEVAAPFWAALGATAALGAAATDA